MEELIQSNNIQSKIFTIRGLQVMIDNDLAEMYGVETKNLNLAVKRNINRFPDKFRFQLTEIEFNEYEKFLRLQIETSNEKRGGRRYLPFVFTEQGVSMLSAVLRSEMAVKVSIQIIEAFVEMRKFMFTNADIFNRLNNLEKNQVLTNLKQLEANNKIEEVLNALEAKEIVPKQNIFYNGQVFDAYTLIADIIRSAQKSIVLIDNYIDDTVFKQLSKRKKSVSVVVYTKKNNSIIKQDLKQHNLQYPKIELKTLKTAHDRFLIIDSKKVYHFGASLKDAGKKWFAFSELNIDAKDILEKL